MGTEKTFVVIPENCTGCRTCELACSMAKTRNGTMGHIRINICPTGKDAYMQMTCFQCVEAACVQVCPSGALVRNEETRAIEVLEDRCIGCGLCEPACPFGHMHFEREEGVAMKCDLCGGNPTCAKFCPHNALEFR